MSKAREYDVFVRKGNEWVLHCTYSSRANAQQEVDYLRQELGVVVGLFVR